MEIDAGRRENGRWSSGRWSSGEWALVAKRMDAGRREEISLVNERFLVTALRRRRESIFIESLFIYNVYLRQSRKRGFTRKGGRRSFSMCEGEETRRGEAKDDVRGPPPKSRSPIENEVRSL